MLCNILNYISHKMANITITHPDVANQWHPTKNGDLKAEHFTKGSGKEVWWLCDKTNCNEKCLHEYESIIGNRTKGVGCPYCCLPCKKICIHNSIENTHTEIAKQWHPTKNLGLKAEQFSYGSTKKIWWLCDKTNCSENCNHDYEASIDSRTMKNTGCPFCSKRVVCIHNSIKYTHPEIAKQWHPTKNLGLKAEQFSYGSTKNIWWLCDKTCKEGCAHEWKTKICDRTKGKGCPHCSCNNIQACCIHESIKGTHFEIAKQWHPTKNGDLKPEHYRKGSNVVVWWLCDKTCKEGCLHEWEAGINNRVNGTSCPYCSSPVKQHCIHNSIDYTHPEIAKQWHQTKNGESIAKNYTSGSGIKVWWICNFNKNHIWKTAISHRINNTGCPYCINKTEQKLYDALIQHYPQLTTQFKVEWCKNKKCLPFDFVIEDYKIIIELDGPQHFRDISNWKSYEDTHLNDVYKMKCANENGYSIIRLLQTDVFYDEYEWLSELKQNIEKIRLEQRIQNIYMCKDNEYDIFIINI
jgi:very-short-patch-repair endonuclease